MDKKIIFTLLTVPFLLAACGSTTIEGEYTPYTLGNGPVLVEEFADFQCPACGQISPLVKAYAQENPNIVTLEYNHFPLGQHENAIPAAIAAECAGEQGNFWGMAERLFEGQEDLNDDLYVEIAKELNLDETQFQSCLQGETSKNNVLISRQEGMQRGVNSTPTFFVSTEGEAPQEIKFSQDFFSFIEQKAKGGGL